MAAQEDEPSSDPSTTWSANADRFNAKRPSEYYEPCKEAAANSLKCMRRTNDRELCADYFKAYRDCKGQWMAERRASMWKKAGWS